MAPVTPSSMNFGPYEVDLDATGMFACPQAMLDLSGALHVRRNRHRPRPRRFLDSGRSAKSHFGVSYVVSVEEADGSQSRHRRVSEF